MTDDLNFPKSPEFVSLPTWSDKCNHIHTYIHTIFINQGLSG